MKKILISTTLLMLLATTLTLWSTKDNNVAFNALAPAASGQGTPDIGGVFALTDQHGKEVKDTDFRGRLMLVFFGFTHCPDICPITTKNLSDTMALLENKADQVAPIFITVDPERDTPSVMASYLSSFDARMIGLSGSADKIKQAADAYKAYYAKATPEDEEEAHDGHNDAADTHDAHSEHNSGGDYQMDHSGFIYLMDRDGKYLTHFQYDAQPQVIVDALKPYLK